MSVASYKVQLIMIPKMILKYIKDELRIASDDGIRKVDALTEGRSGAEVYRISVSSRRTRLSGIYIVKIIDKNDKWYDPNENEGTNCFELSNQEFEFNRRLVKLVANGSVDNYNVLIYRHANDSILNTTALYRLIDSKQLPVVELLSYELLNDWNNDAQTDESPLQNFFNDTLSYRIKDGIFEKRVGSILENPDMAAFSIKNNIYPNPLYYIKNIVEWIGCMRQYIFFKGNLHGDLHRKNILCERNFETQSGVTYFLIDYDSYRKNGYLLFDHAYLELSIFLAQIEEYDPRSLQEVMISMIKTPFYQDASNGIDYKIINYRNAICRGILKWQQKNCPAMSDAIELQFSMSRIAAGINFFCKNAMDKPEKKAIILKYLGICFQNLFNKIDFEWNTDDISRFISSVAETENIDEIWEHCLKYISQYSYVPILVTDDDYRKEHYSKLRKLSSIPWTLVVDIGNKVPPEDFSTIVSTAMSAKRNLAKYNVTDDVSFITYTPNSCIWIVEKKEETFHSYGALWVKYKKIITKLLEEIISYSGLKPLLFIFDVKREASSYVQGFMHHIWNYADRLKGLHFIVFGNQIITNEDINTIEEFNWKFFSLKNGNLLDLANTAEKYIAVEEDAGLTNKIILPTIGEMEAKPLTEKEINYYETSVELVYSGIECKGVDSDFGESFYRGAEISWSDLSNGCDYPLIEDYEEKRGALLSIIENDSPRVKSIKLIHGAGTGGTTLSKRLLWDLKEKIPCVRLKYYSKDTANILLDIYRKTGKRVLLTIEMGSTIMNEDDIKNLISKVNEANGKLLILQIERRNQNKGISHKNNLTNLNDTLSYNIAKNFSRAFSRMTNDLERREFLKAITELNGEWREQRSPFFYGFYTFQEEYRLDNIKRTIKECSEKIQNLLSDLSIITIYSQNICIKLLELPFRLGYDNEKISVYNVYDEIEPAVRKLIVMRDDGLRICHPLIAKKILCEIYQVREYKDSIFEAAKRLLNHFRALYGESSDSTIDNILKELMIDRSYIDSDRTQFSILINEIPEATKRKELFEILIELYPENPHYYNHLARLLSVEANYEDAINLLNKAIDISEETTQNALIHYITLGCVYSKYMLSKIDNEIELLNNGRMSDSFSELIEKIERHYIFADSAFETARQQALKLNSYAYFPQIHMEVRLIQKLSRYNKNNYTIKQLIDNNESFRKWYIDHYGKTIELFMEMQSFYEIYGEANDRYLESSKALIDSLKMEDDSIDLRLKLWIDNSNLEAFFCRRTYSTAIYARAGYNWNNINEEHLRLIAKSMRNNVHDCMRQNIQQRDVDCWFEAYRRLPEFDVNEAILFIQDYKTDGYKKEYLLFWLRFLQMERMHCGSKDVMMHINRCRGMLPPGINNISNRDAYVSQTTGSPIVPYNDLGREGGRLIGLKEFYGTISSVNGSTVGKIQIDHMNLTAEFTPRFTDENNEKREITQNNITNRVAFNLMFSYSGLRAWNVRLIE